MAKALRGANATSAYMKQYLSKSTGVLTEVVPLMYLANPNSIAINAAAVSTTKICWFNLSSVKTAQYNADFVEFVVFVVYFNTFNNKNQPIVINFIKLYE